MGIESPRQTKKVSAEEEKKQQPFYVAVPEAPTEKHARNERLAEQFENPETYTYGSTKVEVFDVRPEQESSNTPVFFGTGWGASRGVYEASILGVAEGGRRTLSVFAPHGIETDPDFGKGDKTYAAAELRKAAAMLRSLEETQVEQVDLVVHSESAIWGLVVAEMHPEKIRNIVLIDPAGIMDGDTGSRLAVGFVKDIVGDAINRENLPRPEIKRGTQPGSAQDTLGALKNMLGSPLRSLKEVTAIGDADIRDILQDLHKQGKKIAVVHGVRDEIFPWEEVKKFLGEENAYDAVFPTYGMHNEINHNPQEYREVINAALSALEDLYTTDKRSV